MDGEPEVPTTIRLPRELRDALRRIAKREARSMHAQVLYFLQRGVEEYDEAERGKVEAPELAVA